MANAALSLGRAVRVMSDLLDLLPGNEIEAVGSRAAELMQPDRSAEGHSEPPLSLPAIP